MSITVKTTDGIEIITNPSEMAGWSGASFPASDRVPGVDGEGFDMSVWFAALAAGRVESTDSALPAPTHLVVKAADEFQAAIPWSQLGGAFFLYAVNGLPLTRGGPLRLYVPNGTSACLNVKNIVHIHFASEPDLGEKAAYGFRNEISPVRMLEGLRSDKDTGRFSEGGSDDR
jgi:hypothetical protein